MQLPDVLLLTGNDRRRDEFRAYSDGTGAIVYMTDDMASAAQWWPAAPLVVVAPDMVPPVITSALPTAERCGEVVLLSNDSMLLAAHTGIAVGAKFVIHEGRGAAWLLRRMMLATARGTQARATINDARTAGI